MRVEAPVLMERYGDEFRFLCRTNDVRGTVFVESGRLGLTLGVG